MDTIIRLFVLLLASHLNKAEHLTEAMQKKSDAYMAYASDYSDRYEPMTFAAVSLHPPMPVLHILTSNPMAPISHNALATSLSHALAMPYARPYAPYARPYQHAPSPSQKYNTILYARPDKYGGYTYYKKTKNAPKNTNKRPSLPNRPVILRIHKYRVVRDR